jgi:hypothetical protein
MSMSLPEFVPATHLNFLDMQRAAYAHKGRQTV